MRYLTKEWYIACQADPMTPEVQKQLDEIDRAYCAAQTRETLPDGLLQQFFLPRRRGAGNHHRDGSHASH